MRFGRHDLSFSRPLIMGVLNVTPDSFYDGGCCYASGRLSLDAVLRRAEQMVEEGADFIDIGGESTRPGATPVSVSEECDRVLPVVSALAERFDVVISLDTSNAAVMREGTKLGAGLINDVRALQQAGALEAAVEASVPVCLMHMQGTPQTMQANPDYDDPIAQVHGFLSLRRQACLDAGISEEQIVVDPGIGFGKVDEHNLALIRSLKTFTNLGPVLLGVSRKSMFGRLLGRKLPDRLPGSLAVALIGCQNGASIIRVHDVAATRDIITMYELIIGELPNISSER